MKTVIVIPTYNEKENVMVLIPEIFKYAPAIGVLIADDSSPDGTAAAVGELQKQFPNLMLLSQPEKGGLGKAYLNAFKKALEDPAVEAVMMMDADLSHDPKYLPEMLKRAETFSVVTGSRYIKGGGTSGWEAWRRTLSFCGNLYCRLVTRLPLKDCTAGFNVISAKLLRQIDFSKISMAGYAFIMELKYRLFKAGGTFSEVPIIFKNRTIGVSKMSAHIIQEGIIAPWKMVLKK